MRWGMGRVSRRTTVVAVAALTMAVSLTAAGSAHALLGLNLNLSLTAKPVATVSASATVTTPPPTVSLTASLTSPLVSSLTGGLTSLTSGQTQLLDTAGNLLCDPLSQVGGLIPGGSVLGTAGCALGALDYQWVTRLKTANGEIVRRQVALVNVPTLLNVDADILPDLIGTVQVLALDKFTLRVDRVLGEVSSLPVRVEAVLDDPTGGLPRDRINVGYDARDSVAPTSWVTTATLPEDGADDLTTLNITQDVTGAIPSVTTVGGLFDGDSLDREDPMGGTLKYTPAPAQARLGLTLGRYMEVRAGASTPVGVQGSAEIVNGAREQRGQFEITGLPQQIAVRYEEPGTNQRTVTYTGSAVVPAIDATYTDRTGGTLTSKAIAHLKDIPTGMVVKQTGAKSGTFQATGGALGSVEVGYANGEPQLLNVDHPYARVVQEGALNSYAGRIDGLLSASVDATDDIVGELQLGPDARKKFRALVETPGRKVDALVSNLPRHLKVTYDVDQGLIDYNAFGETIEAITLDAEQTTPFFGRVKRIHGLIEQLPSQATVRIKPEGGGFKLETNNPIGKAEALLTSGPDASLPAGQLGAQVEDLTARFTAFARVQGLRLVDVTTGPGDAVKGHVKLASTPLRLRYLKEGQTIDASLSAIPSDVTVAFDPDAGKLDYDANAGIDSIDATVTSDTALFGRVKRIVARVEGLPERVSVGLKPATGSGVAFSATPAVGMIQAELTDGVAHATLADGKSGVVLRDVPAEFALFGRLFNVSSASVVTSGSNLDASLVTGPLPDNDLQDLDLDVTFDTPGDAVTDPAHIVGFVQDLPSTLTLAQHGSTTTYDASSTVPKVTLNATNLPGGTSGGSLDGDLHNVIGTLLTVPKHFQIVSTSTTTGIQDVNGAFGRVDLEAWDHGPANAALPEDDRNKVALTTRDGRLHVQARVFDLNKVLLTDILGTKVQTAFVATPKPLDIAVDGGTGAEPLDLDVTAGDLPLASTFDFSTVGGMKIKWDVHDGAAATGTDVDVNVSSKDVGAVLDVDDLPTHVDVCIGGRLECNPQSKQIVLVDPGIFSDSTHVAFFNNFTAATEANGIIRMTGKVCLPPTDDDGEALDPPGTVYGTCIAGTAPNRIEIDDLRIKTTRLEFAAGDSNSLDGDGDPIEDDLLKLYLDSDDEGIRVGELKVRNDTSDSTTIIRAGDPPLTNTGDFFFGLFDLSVPPSQEDEPRVNQIECGDLDVEVDLPVLGLTDVLPGLGEFFLGDICSG